MIEIIVVTINDFEQGDKKYQNVNTIFYKNLTFFAVHPDF